MVSNKTFFENKIKPVLQYIGSIGAVVLMLAYIIVVVVMIQGFDASNTEAIQLNIVFAIITGLMGFVIMQFLKIQGITFAKMLPDNQEVLKEYSSLTVKKGKKLRSLKFFWWTTVVKDFGIRCLTLILSTISIVWFVIEGTKDWNLLLLAIVNLLMFICFGFLQLVKAYDFYNEQHINYIKQQILELKGEQKECLTSETKNLEISKNK